MYSCMMKVLILVSFVIWTYADEKRYRAAVAEHNIFKDDSLSLAENMALNLDLYSDLVTISSKNGAQIIVFPEFGLNPIDNNDRSQLEEVAERIPDPNGRFNPCNENKNKNETIIYRVSCMARDNSISVLVNMVDWVDCQPESAFIATKHQISSKPEPATECPVDAKFLYNTNVVFNEDGEIVSKYHKSHEWYPLMPSYNQPATPDNATYSPTWGPEFGIFTCFDIMWPTPAVTTYIDKMHLSHFLYPVQQGELGDDTIIPHWSKKHSTTILSSNLGDKAIHDVSSIYVSGEELEFDKIYLPVVDDDKNKFYTDFRAKENVKISNVYY
jgi:predicted amidohydrolase